MSGLENADERQLLRSIGRRRMVRGLTLAVPTLAAWWLSSRWIAQHWNLQPNLVRFAVALVFIVPGILAPGWLGKGLGHDPRETARLRWLNQERADRQVLRSHILMAICLSGTLLEQCAGLLGPVQASAPVSGSDGLVWILLASLGLRWRPTDLGDEGAQFRYLVAVNRAFLVTLVTCLGAIVLDAYRGGGILRPALEAALLAGCLTLQLSLIISERRAAPNGG